MVFHVYLTIVQLQCAKCDETFDIIDAPIRVINEYRLRKIANQRCRSGYLMRPSLKTKYIHSRKPS
jgi:hypothetical protein